MTDDGDPDPDPAALHERTFLLDAHSDMLYSVVREREAGRTGVVESDFLPEMRAGGIDARVAAVYLDDEFLPELATRRCLRVVEAFHREVEETPALAVATTAADLRRGGGAGVGAVGDDAETVPLLLALEGAEPIQDDPALLGAFHRLGVRLVTLTHARRNALADGAPLDADAPARGGGLSDAGVETVERAGELGVVVDVSHLNQPGFWDVLEVADGPVVASHSNCRAVHDHPRNLTDDQLRAVADADGVVGMMAVALMLGGDATLETFVEHVSHAVDVAGVEHVGLGLDFFHYTLQYASAAKQTRRPEFEHVEGLEGDEALVNLTPALLDHGFSEGEIERLYGENFLRVFEAVFGE